MVPTVTLQEVLDVVSGEIVQSLPERRCRSHKFTMVASESHRGLSILQLNNAVFESLEDYEAFASMESNYFVNVLYSL